MLTHLARPRLTQCAHGKTSSHLSLSRRHSPPASGVSGRRVGRQTGVGLCQLTRQWLFRLARLLHCDDTTDSVPKAMGI
jgi:hypothetical protein